MLVIPARGGATLHPAALNVVVILIRLGAAPHVTGQVCTLLVLLVLVNKGNNARPWRDVLGGTAFKQEYFDFFK